MVDYNKERQFLEFVKNAIQDERIELQKSLEKIPWEYKGRYSDVKWGDEDLVDNLTSIYTSRLKKIENLEQNPYFGSFTFASEQNNPQEFRIGKTDVMSYQNPLVLDWRNPICTLYYDQSLGTASYTVHNKEITGELTSKNQILIENGQVKSIKDVDLVSDDELLQPYLDINADNKMKTIIASIQAEQNNIIRKSIYQNLIVQGVAGSGKTSVALHRIAYLLYNYSKKEIDANKFVIIGPNKYFLHYISSILPDLDTQRTNEYTFEELAREIIDEPKFYYETSQEELNKRLKTNSQKKQSRIKGSMEYKQSLERFLKDYINNAITTGIMFEDIEIVSKEELYKGLILTENYSNLVQNRIKAHIQKTKELAETRYYDLVKPLMEEMKQYPLKSDERNAVIARMDILKAMMKKGCAQEIKKTFKPLLLSPINLYKIFIENIDKYLDLPQEELLEIKEETLKMLKKKIIPYEDLAAISYLSLLYKGSSNYKKFRHIVIDEAQDYNLFQFYILKNTFSNSTFSIFGDLAQSIYSYRTISSWDTVQKDIFNNKCELLYMLKSYRTTKEITDASNYILRQLELSESIPVIRNGENIEFCNTPTSNFQEEYYLSKISEFIDKKYKSVGIICKNESEMEEVKLILTKLQIPFNYVTSKDLQYHGGISILTSYLAKGLEFDAVIINNASEEKYNSNSKIDMHLLYVAMTRALHELDIMYTNDLSYVLEPINKTKEKTKRLIK